LPLLTKKNPPGEDESGGTSFFSFVMLYLLGLRVGATEAILAPVRLLRQAQSFEIGLNIVPREKNTGGSAGEHQAPDLIWTDVNS
jgi:hypothetical protein